LCTVKPVIEDYSYQVCNQVNAALQDKFYLPSFFCNF
jgi:hypothetical protein